MAELLGKKETSVDLRDGTVVQVRKVVLVSTADHIFIDGASDVGLLNTARTTSDPSFYLTAGSFNIDGGTVGDEHLVVSRHEGSINFSAGGS